MDLFRKIFKNRGAFRNFFGEFQTSRIPPILIFSRKTLKYYHIFYRRVTQLIIRAGLDNISDSIWNIDKVFNSFFSLKFPFYEISVL